MADPVLSVVMPVYNEEKGIEEFYAQLSSALQGLGISSEMVFVDDGSEDSSAALLGRIRKADPRVRLFRLTRNFGHQIAIKAGIDLARGDAVVTMDADLQDPPDVIGEMVREWQNGHDVVYAVRERREGETFFKKFTSALYYRLLRCSSSVKIPLDTGDFRLMSRSVADVIRSVDEKEPYIRGWVAWAATNPKPVRIARRARFAGETKYSLYKMLRLAASGFVQFSLRRPHAGRMSQGPRPRPSYTLMEDHDN